MRAANSQDDVQLNAMCRRCRKRMCGDLGRGVDRHHNPLPAGKQRASEPPDGRHRERHRPCGTQELEPSMTSPKRTQVLPSHFCNCIARIGW